MTTITLYSTRACPFCVQAENLLASRGLRYRKLLVDDDQDRFDEMIARSGQRTVPQIFIGDRHVGGFTDLRALALSGELEPWLEKAACAPTCD